MILVISLQRSVLCKCKFIDENNIFGFYISLMLTLVILIKNN